jgi:DNA adenine methylase
MAKNKLATPFLKWVGGKRQLIEQIKPCLPKDISKLKYIEPFLGGGAMYFHLQKKHAVINDANSDLILAYHVVKDHLNELIDSLKKHENTASYFYKIRELDRLDGFNKLSNIERASRLIYLNKTCFNGLYRVNNSGEFNSPFGHYKNPNIVNEPVLKAVSSFLHDADVQILNVDYAVAASLADDKTFVYLDPPYHPVSNGSSFTGYVQGGWREEEQVRLKETCDELNEKGVKFLLSNSSSKFILDLYKNYSISTVRANRAINSIGDGRGAIDEVLIRNYE